jgi:hypothetical protein
MLVNCVAPGLLDGTRATASLKPEQIERSAPSSLLKKPADEGDCADIVVTMCRTETLTGQPSSSIPVGYFIETANLTTKWSGPRPGTDSLCAKRRISRTRSS